MKKLLLTIFLSLIIITNSYAQSRVYPENGVLGFGGLDDTSDSTQVKDNRASDIQNITLNIDGTAQKRNGYSRKNISLDTNATTDDFEAVTSIYELRKSTGTNYFIATCGNKLFWDNSGVWNDMTAGLTITEGQNNQWSWITALDYAIGTNGTDPPIQWNGVNNASTVSFTGLSNAITKAKCAVWWKNYLIFGNTTEGGTNYTSRIRWPNVGTIGTWSDNDYVDIATQGGQQIEGFGILYDNLIIFLTNSIYKVSLVGGDELIVITKVAEGIGCIAKNSIQNILINNTESLIFLSKDATINQFDGIKVTETSILIRGTLDSAKISRLQYAVSANDTTNSHYYLSLTNTNAATTNNLLLDYYYEVGEWSKHTHIYANAMGIADDSDNLPQVYFGNYKSFVYQLNNFNNINDVAGYAGKFTSEDIIDTNTASGQTILYDTGFSFYDVLLMHCDGVNGSTNFIDEAGHDVTAYGNANITTTDNVFGNGCILLDGTGDYASVVDNDSWSPSGDFTIEFRIKFTSLASEVYILSHTESNLKFWEIYHNGTNQISWHVYNSGYLDNMNATWSPSTATWYHFAITRSGNNTRMFVDGTQIGTTDTTVYTIPNFQGALVTTYGVTPGTRGLDGKLDEIRFSNGIARFTSNFTSSTQAYDASNTTASMTGSLVSITSGTGKDEELTVSSTTASGIVVIGSTNATTNSIYSIGAIDAYWVSKWMDMGSPAVRKNYKDLFLWTTKKPTMTMFCENATEESNTIASQSLVDYTVNSIWGVSIKNSAWSGEELSFTKMPINQSGRFLKVKFSEAQINETMKLHSSAYIYDVLDIY